MIGVIVVNPVGIEETGSNSPTQFSVSQNYPNPFSTSTLIEYELDMPAMTELVIYNTSGQRVNSLVKQYATPGRYSVMWNGLDANGERLSDGVFFYALKVGDDVIHKKMMMIR
jgi:hypothetical protein